MSSADRARKMIEMVGGTGKMLAQAKEALKAKQFQ